MQVSLPGLLEKAARACEQTSSNGTNRFGGEAFAIRELLKNLRELRDRQAEGEAVIAEFFRLYIIGD